MLLALFLVDAAAGLYLFLPLVGRRNAGVKFYRLILLTGASLALGAAIAHAMAAHRELAYADVAIVALTLVVWFVLRYPKRLIYRAASVLLGIAYLVAAVLAYHAAVRPPHLAWSIAGALASLALLGSVNLAMLLGHWYLVVRGMSIDPLKRLTIATLVTACVKIALVAVVVVVSWPGAFVKDIFFWMRALWGLLGPLALYPMVWGTVRTRSTMAATGILYVDVVAVVIGEVLGGWLSALTHLPL
ncbi:MAG: hypothetical protein JO197_18425 [Acidobacteria bacterium]|nr:hypothetical protein [Acidobacteriota bacterium]MBV9479080.1 hypothetical protein [Acidobacteriota bacterium]